VEQAPTEPRPVIIVGSQPLSPDLDLDDDGPSTA
jgi:hypothetical protein